MIDRYNESWEKQYELFRLSEEEMNRASDRDSYLFNYITNDLGFRIGVVVAQKRSDNEAPYIGWALFSEITMFPNVIIDSFYDIPKFQKFMDTSGIASLSRVNANSKLIQTLMDFKLSDFELDIRQFPATFHIPSKHYRDYMINLALARAIPYTEENSHNFYCPYVSEESAIGKNVDLLTLGSLSFGTTSEHRTDLLEERIEFKIHRNSEALANNFGNFAYDTATSNHVRHSIRKMEYRAWKYFKKSF